MTAYWQAKLQDVCPLLADYRQLAFPKPVTPLEFNTAGLGGNWERAHMTPDGHSLHAIRQLFSL